MDSINQEDRESAATIMSVDETPDLQAVEYGRWVKEWGLDEDGGLPINSWNVFNETDLGNARRMAQYFKHVIRYVNGWGWLTFDGTRWCKDETNASRRIARGAILRIYQEAAACKDINERSELGKWAVQSESLARIKAMVELAQSEHNLAIRHSTFDTDPLLFNCANGTIDLRTGELLPHDSYDFLTKGSDVIYTPDAQCPIWQARLLAMMNGDTELVDYIQRAVGYSLSSLTSEQCLFFLYGYGKNGKSLFAEIMRRILGDYWMKAPASMLMMKHSDNTNDLARLPGARMVVSSETTAGRRIDEALVKDITGDDVITARFLNKEFLEFKPTFKLWIYGNYKPIIKGNDDGIWRRLRIIPFTVRFYSPSDIDYDANGPQADSQLAQKLEAELPGILAWAVRGYLAWQQQGLGMPRAVQDATQKYREEMDVVGAFLEENCIQQSNSTGLKASVDTVFQAFTQWCAEDSGEPPMRRKEFNQLLEKRGFQKGRSTGGRYYWFGLGIVDQHRTEYSDVHDDGTVGEEILKEYTE